MLWFMVVRFKNKLKCIFPALLKINWKELFVYLIFTADMCSWINGCYHKNKIISLSVPSSKTVYSKCLWIGVNYLYSRMSHLCKIVLSDQTCLINLLCFTRFAQQKLFVIHSAAEPNKTKLSHKNKKINCKWDNKRRFGGHRTLNNIQPEPTLKSRGWRN